MFLHYYKMKVNGKFDMEIQWSVLSTIHEDPDEKAFTTLSKEIDVPVDHIEMLERVFVGRYDSLPKLGDS